MPAEPHKITLLYDDSGYVELLKRPKRAAPDGPVGLMGRQVAGKEFLDAYLHHGHWQELVALVRNRRHAESLIRYCKQHPSSRQRQRRLSILQESEFSPRFFPEAPASPIYLPSPPDSRFAWLRQQAGPHAFALCGVTHTLCSTAVIRQLGDLITAPFQPYDALICTSQAVRQMVQAVTGTYADFLRERHGGTPQVTLRLETLPLGVNPERFRPPTPAEKALQRRALSIAEDEIAVLFVGRLSHHAKAHPFPMYHGLAMAARRTQQKVHLILSGWAANEAIQQAFVAGARVLAPNVRVSFVDGTSPQVRFGVWQAADLFTSLSDNIQETFGLVILEALASGLPVVAADWNGYRDLVADGATGYLVPTLMLPHATSNTTARLLFGEINYDQFLGECSQATVVDVAAAADAYARLLTDPALRRHMGDAGRQRVLERFTWEKVIRAYETLWHEQEQQRRACAAFSETKVSRSDRARSVSEGRGSVLADAAGSEGPPPPPFIADGARSVSEGHSADGARSVSEGHGSVLADAAGSEGPPPPPFIADGARSVSEGHSADGARSVSEGHGSVLADAAGSEGPPPPPFIADGARSVSEGHSADGARSVSEGHGSVLADAAGSEGPPPSFTVPSCYPPPEHAFAGYPTRWLQEQDRFQATANAADWLETLLRLPLTSHCPDNRCTDAARLRAVLNTAATPCPLAELETVLLQAGISATMSRATLAWMLKYGLLQREGLTPSAGS